jgi:predicted RNA-binding protein with PUA-like domain
MNYNLNRLLNDLVRDKELIEQLKLQPEIVARNYNQSADLIQSIKEGDILTLYREGAQPLLIMHLASLMKFNVADRYQELLDKEQSGAP